MIRSRLILEQQRWYRDTLLRGKNFFLEIKSIGILDVPRKPSYHRASQFPLSTHTDGDIGLKKSGRLRERRGRRREKGIDFFSSARSPISRMFRRRVESSKRPGYLLPVPPLLFSILLLPSPPPFWRGRRLDTNTKSKIENKRDFRDGIGNLAFQQRKTLKSLLDDNSYRSTSLRDKVEKSWKENLISHLDVLSAG